MIPVPSAGRFGDIRYHFCIYHFYVLVGEGEGGWDDLAVPVRVVCVYLCVVWVCGFCSSGSIHHDDDYVFYCSVLSNLFFSWLLALVGENHFGLRGKKGGGGRRGRGQGMRRGGGDYLTKFNLSLSLSLLSLCLGVRVYGEEGETPTRSVSQKKKKGRTQKQASTERLQKS